MKGVVDNFLGSVVGDETVYVTNAAPGMRLNAPDGTRSAELRVYSGTVLVSKSDKPLIVDLDAETYDDIRDLDGVSLTSSSDPYVITGSAVFLARVINAGTCTVLASCEMQQVMPPSSGTFTLSLPWTNTSFTLDYDATRREFQDKLDQQLRPGNSYVVGDDGGPWDVYFVGDLQHVDLSLLSMDSTAVGLGGYVVAGYTGTPPAETEHAILQVQYFS